MTDRLVVITADAIDGLRTLPDASAQTCVTSPPYWGLRDYGCDGQIGLEQTPEQYVSRLVDVFREVRRVLADDGTLWLNLGDSYASDMKGTGGRTEKQTTSAGTFFEPRRLAHGVKPKDLVGIPWMVAFALRSDGWYLRSDIIWAKPNPMPESIKDRPTKAHEYVFLLSKGPRYFYDAEAVKESAIHEGRLVRASGSLAKNGAGATRAVDRRTASGFTSHDTLVTGRNKRSVWPIATQPCAEAHFATMPPLLAETCIKAGSRIGDTVLDPFGGAGTTALAALELGRRAVLVELNPEYVEIIERRTRAAQTRDDVAQFALL